MGGHMKQAGAIHAVHWVSKGKAVVVYRKKSSAAKAAELNETVIEGNERYITVITAKSRAAAVSLRARAWKSTGRFQLFWVSAFGSFSVAGEEHLEQVFGDIARLGLPCTLDAPGFRRASCEAGFWNL